MEKKTRERELQELEREKRLRRAGEQRRRTLEMIHKMDWTKTEIREEGEGARMEITRNLRLINATSVEGERKRKHMKKLRWTEAARLRASLAGRITRVRKKAWRRLPAHEHGLEDHMELDLVVEEMEVQDLTDQMSRLMESKADILVKEGGLDQGAHLVEDLSRLSLSTEGAHGWEIDAHVWLASMTTREPRGKTKWFEYDEERKEHSAIEELISALSITESNTTITLPMEISWQPCPECVEWLLSEASHMLSWEGTNISNLMALKITKIPTKKLYLTGKSSWSIMYGR